MNKKYSLWCAALFFSISGSAIAQSKVTFDPTCQRFIGKVSDLDRTKYFTIHSNSSTDPEHKKLFRDFNVSLGRGFYGPFSHAKSKTGEVGKYPAPKSSSDRSVRETSRFVATEHPKNVVRYNKSAEKAANWVAEYYKNFVDKSGRPEFFEPMNEPFVHSDDDVFAAQQPDSDKMRRRMAEWFAAIGKKLDNTPELAKMKVVGYSSAWPSMELQDFGHWKSRMKMFMDVAGPSMDAFATHLYDGINVTGQDSRRSGSNSEAILDLIETYSFIKWGQIKPHAITEYGGITRGDGPEYSDITSVQTIKSSNNMLFNFLERGDRMAISIPFNTGKGTWHINKANNYQPYGAATWRPLSIVQTDNPNRPRLSNWVYTSKVHFYRLWSDVKGKRIQVKSNNPDVQVQGFVSGKTVYLSLNNLDDASQTVDLDMVGKLSGLRNVRTKSLKIYNDKNPIYKDTESNSAPDKITLEGGETVVLAYTYGSTITFANSIKRKDYYNKKYLQEIKSRKVIDFEFDGVSTGTGHATLKMAIGRKHNRSKSPILKVNGTRVAVPTNWKGYDQKNRSDFFGTIDIPVAMNLLKNKNKVTLEFPDNGGRVSSLILTVERFDKAVTTEQLIKDGTYYLTSATGSQRLLSKAADEHNAQMTGASSSNDQKWVIEHLGNDVYTLKNQSTGRYLEVPFAKCENGENVATWPNVSGTHKQWKIEANGNGYSLKPMHCQTTALDRDKGELDANVHVWAFNASNNNQKWKILPAGTGNRSSKVVIEDQEQNPVSLYPNPVVDIMSITGLEDNELLVIRDARGMEMMKVNLSDDNTIDIAQLRSGFYLITTKSGKSIRFVKQ